MPQILKPTRETLEILGKLSYGEGTRSWNTIRFKQDILKEFPQLKQRRERFGYKMIMYRTYKELLKKLKKMEEEKEVIPIFLYLVRE